MKWLAILVILCVSGLAVTASGQTQDAKLQHLERPTGAVNLEVVSGGRQGSLYTLRLMKVSDTKPLMYVWVLQEQPIQGAIGLIKDRTRAFKSLSSSALREYVSHLPPGTRIVEPGVITTDSDPSHKPGTVFEKDLQAFVMFCRDKHIDVKSGVIF